MNSQATNSSVNHLSWATAPNPANPANLPLKPVQQATQNVGLTQLQPSQGGAAADSKALIDLIKRQESKTAERNDAQRGMVGGVSAAAAAVAVAAPVLQNLPARLPQSFDIILTGKTSPAALKAYMFQLGVELMQYQSKKNPNASSIVSPFSAMQVLGMLLNGMSDPNDLARVGLRPEDLKSLNASLKQISAEVCETGHKESAINSYNALFMLGEGFLKEFQAMVQSDYSGEVFTINDPDKVMTWLKSKKVPEQYLSQLYDLMKPALTQLSKNCEGALVNALIFDTIWQLHFEQKNTTDGFFTCLSGERVSAKIMHHHSKFLSVVRENDYTAVVLPYKGTDLSCVIVIPKTSEEMERIQGRLPIIIPHALRNGSATIANVQLPRQKFRYKIDVLEALKQAGYPTRVALNKMMPKAFISSVEQYVIGETNEGGTKLVAATLGLSARCLPANVDCTRPHFAAIVQKGVPIAFVRNSGREFIVNGPASDSQSMVLAVPAAAAYNAPMYNLPLAGMGAFATGASHNEPMSHLGAPAAAAAQNYSTMRALTEIWDEGGVMTHHTLMPAPAPVPAAADIRVLAGVQSRFKVKLTPVQTKEARMLSRPPSQTVSLNSITEKLPSEFRELALLTHFKVTPLLQCHDVRMDEGTQLVIVNSAKESVHFNLDRELFIDNMPVCYLLNSVLTPLKYTIDNCLLFVLKHRDSIVIVELDFGQKTPNTFKIVKKEAGKWVVDQPETSVIYLEAFLAK